MRRADVPIVGAERRDAHRERLLVVAPRLGVCALVKSHDAEVVERVGHHGMAVAERGPPSCQHLDVCLRGVRVVTLRRANHRDRVQQVDGIEIARVRRLVDERECMLGLVERRGLVALAGQDHGAGVRDSGECTRRGAGADGLGLGHGREREPLTRPLLLVAYDPRELAPRGRRDLVEVCARCCLHALVERGLGGGEAPRVVIDLAEEQTRLGDERRPAEPARARLDLLGVGPRREPLAGPQLRLRGRQLGSRAGDQRALCRVIGKRHHGGQSVAIGAGRDRRQRGDGLDRARDACGIHPGNELVDERVELVAPASETPHPEIEQRRALLATDAGRATRLAVHHGPGRGALVERRADLGRGLGGEARARRLECRGQPRSGGSVPHSVEMARGILARRGSRAARRQRRGHARHDHDGERDRRELAPAPRRIRAERREHLVHRAIAIGGPGGERAEQDAAHPHGRRVPRRHRTEPAGRRGREVLLEVLALKRSLAEQQLPARDRERELVGARVEHAGAALLRGHVHRRPGDPADDEAWHVRVVEVRCRIVCRIVGCIVGRIVSRIVGRRGQPG